MLVVNELYKCEFCDHPVDPKGESTAELVTAWILKGRAVKQVQRTWRFVHKVCLEHDPRKDTQESLFG